MTSTAESTGSSAAPGKEALVSAAERLIAERGFHGVAAREVVKESGHKNNSAINYHFGSWQGLLDGIWQRHSVPISRERAERLADIGDNSTLPELVAVYIGPLVNEVARATPSYWARYNEQWLASTPLDVTAAGWTGTLSRVHTPELPELYQLGALLDQIAAQLDWLPADDRRRRVSLMSRFVIVALAAVERDAARETHDPARTDPRWPDVTAELVTLALALLRAG
ncbi:TetR/AcrR family transcriptional regulator [Jongsikchunia kroppenstedtii]|uniref:TetR/AcrR family transcriptional regulator n=1 Tax=Jongsikchunia kroppenstedtii TaxID=1121721 RepID=UPI00035E90B6|nr:helix-turn-helix domain-containing protein [Jongsikchunia kroppenstedtii]